ncbi:MAG: S41 family peptidase [Bacteroidota bacterium]|nr:S41 family peptidase [Bacteroidota bacterium]
MKLFKAILLLFTFCIPFISFSSEDSPLWLRYCSISPDGKYIAFCYKGDIYKVSSSGGTAIPITVHTAYDYRPVWSPDGKYIAFSSNRYGNFDVFIVSSDGGEAKRLTYYSANDYVTSFSPDGKNVLFTSSRVDIPENAQYPSPALSELYSVSISGGREKMVLTTPAEDAKYDKNMKYIVYQDRKGYENEWRKHHISSVTRDIWLYNIETKKHRKLTSFEGEDRNPVFSGENEIIYLSEMNGSFNVFKANINEPFNPQQITFHKNHPVRFLSVSDNGIICYSYNGEIYTKLHDQKESQKVNIIINTEDKENSSSYITTGGGATEMALSPNGKEVAFIVRGEVFVASVDYGITKRITNTPEQERSVSFSPDGKALLYASERNNSWKLYQTKLERKDEKYFYNSTVLKEEPILESDLETFQPKFSPDGKEVAFLEERTTLKVINLETHKIRTILDGKYNYSYSDGDQWYDWSPDGKWFLVQYLGEKRWSAEVGLVDAGGKQEIFNLTKSGYNDASPKWMMGGKMMIWISDRNGMRSHGSWGSEYDVYGMFFTQNAFDKFKATKEEYEAIKEKEKKDKEEKDKEAKEKETKKNKNKDTTTIVEPIKIELDNIEDRKARLTINSSHLADAILSPDGEKLYYLSRFEGGYDLWVNKLRDHETKLLLKLEGGGGDLQFDKDGKTLFMFSGGKIIKINTENLEKKDITFNAEMILDKPAERAYMFEHVWRQVKKKFYEADLHNVDWDFYKKEYSRFLPYINNNFDFAEMLSELLGELNGSHTGSGYSPSYSNPDATAKLGVYFDEDYEGNGLKIKEIMDKSPFRNANSGIKAGDIIEKIDNNEIKNDGNYYIFLNHKSGKPTLLSLYDPISNKRWEETVKPISIGQENELMYQRWVKKRREETEKVSKGRIGYVHVRGMNDDSFRETYSEVLGRNNDKEALIVDTRFNGGGWLHDDLATLLSGKKYIDYVPRGQYIGSDPMGKWTKKSVVLVNESNYSDAHGFPYVYKTLNIGKLVGMPVPGTMTAVWWETLQDNSLYFGIPQVGTRGNDGKYLENQQLMPDNVINNDYEVVAKGKDQQLEKGVEVLLEELDKK